jgi:hypothetical protein
MGTTQLRQETSIERGGGRRAILACTVLAGLACSPSKPQPPAVGSAPSPEDKAQAMGGIVAIDISATGSAPEALVAHASDSVRARLTGEFAQYAKLHGELERALGITPHDPACAIATFVAGALMASQVDVPFEAFNGLRTQLRQGFAAHPDLAAALHLDRSTVIEQYEILGAWLTGHSGKIEANSRPLMRAVANYNVERYLGLDLADVEITSTGLRWTRGTPSGPLAVLIAGAQPSSQR